MKVSNDQAQAFPMIFCRRGINSSANDLPRDATETPAIRSRWHGQRGKVGLGEFKRSARVERYLRSIRNKALVCSLASELSMGLLLSCLVAEAGQILSLKLAWLLTGCGLVPV